MKNKVFNKICSFVLALVMALAILPVTAFADDEVVVKINLPDSLQLVSATGTDEQHLNDGTDFTNIEIEPKSGYALTSDFLTLLNRALSDSNLKATLDGYDNGRYTDKGKTTTDKVTISLADGKSSSDVTSTTVTITNDKFRVKQSYIMYGGTSIVGSTDNANKMKATYSTETGKLEFECKNTGPVEFYNSEGSKSYYIASSGFTRFYAEVLKGESETALTLVGGLSLGGKNADATYASTSTTDPYINLKKYVYDNKAKFADTDTVWVKVSPCYDGEKVYESECYFYIKVGTVNSITTSKVSLTLPDGLKLVEGSGDLTQELTGGYGYKAVRLKLQSGYAFGENVIASGSLCQALLNTNLGAVYDPSTNILTIEANNTGRVKNATVTAEDFGLVQTYVMYNDAFSVVGKTGDENKMNAKYDGSSGKLTFDCARTGALEYYDQNGKRSDYNGFSRFYVTVYESNESGEIDAGTKLKEFNLGDGSGAKSDPDYASDSTIDPYINLKKLVKENSENLKSTDVIWVKVRACSSIMLNYGNVFFKIRVGTVKEILDEVVPTPTPTSSPTAEPTVSPTVEPTVAPTASPTTAPTASPTATPEAKKSSSKKSSGWDDGSPFTTDTCGNVFDRWGNKIYEAKGCNVGGYNLVRTSVED